MNVPAWLKSIFAFGGDFLAIFLADKAAMASDKSAPPAVKVVGAVAQKLEAMKFDRPTFLRELRIINADTDGGVQEILDLFTEFERKGCVLWVGRGKNRRSYTENWTGKMLESISPEYRQVDYPWLSGLLRQDPSRLQFFAMLEVLNDDKLVQALRQAWQIYERSPIGKSIKDILKTANGAAEEIADGMKTIATASNGQKLSDQVRAWALKQ